MRRILFSSMFALMASTAIAQQPTQAVPTSLVPLDGIAAVVGDQPITRFDLEERVVGKIQRKEVPEPADSAALLALQLDVLNDMIEEELILQKAKELKIEVADADISPAVDRQLAQTRSQFPSEADFRNALAKAGLGSPEEYRRFLMDQYRRQATLDKTIKQLITDNKIVAVNVSDAEVEAEFERTKNYLPKKPPSVTFRQIVMAPQPTEAAKAVAKAKAESLLVELKNGADFELLAKRESMDLTSKDAGGDIGWSRRNKNLPGFDRWLFGSTFQAPLQPGQVSPVFETAYGYHIVRVDRVQPGEVKAHQILIAPVIDSADIARTAVLADSVAKLWKSGVPFDTLAKKYHDYADQEETSILTPFWRDSLPLPYQTAFASAKPNDIVVFQIPGSARRPNVPKYVVAQLLTVDQGGDRTLAEVKAAIRSDLAQRGGINRYVASLKKQTYVAIEIGKSADADRAKAKP